MSDKRAETGLMRFEGDWTGVFIRGDTARAYLQVIGRLRDSYPRSFDREVLSSLVNLLESSRETETPHDVQELRAFECCSVVPDQGG